MQQAARQGGAGVLASLLQHWQPHAPREVILCECAQRMSHRGRRAKKLLTTLGRVPFGRSLYQCDQCRQSRFPEDERVVEAGCRTVIGQRLKQTGMRWSVRGAYAISAWR